MQKFLLLTLSYLFIQTTLAQDQAQMEIKLSSDSITLGNYFSVQIRLWNEEKASFILPSMDEAEIKLISNKVNSSNEELTQEWIFKVIPLYEGSYYLPKMNIKTEESYKINIDAIRFTVDSTENETTQVRCETKSPLTLTNFEYTEIKKGFFKRSKKNDKNKG